jgi:hypothetical protein
VIEARGVLGPGLEVLEASDAGGGGGGIRPRVALEIGHHARRVVALAQPVERLRVPLPEVPRVVHVHQRGQVPRVAPWRGSMFG